MLVVTGLMNKQIAAQLGVTEATVKFHRGRVREKLGVRSVAALVKMAARRFETGLVCHWAQLT